jgi:hypothetical protein
MTRKPVVVGIVIFPKRVAKWVRENRKFASEEEYGENAKQ